MAKIKHGGCGTLLYNVWKTIRQRCHNPNSENYQWYGAKGITICSEWDDYAQFREWAMQNGYEPGLTIDRKDGNKDYCPDNCQWITIQEQQQNKSNVSHYWWNGEYLTVRELSDIAGITPMNFHDRKHKGWSLERIMTTPLITQQGGYRPQGKAVMPHVN